LTEKEKARKEGKKHYKRNGERERE